MVESAAATMVRLVSAAGTGARGGGGAASKQLRRTLALSVMQLLEPEVRAATQSQRARALSI
jgi:hypothetical protein